MSEIVLAAEQLQKVYHDGEQPIEVFANIEFSLHAGEQVAIMGPSGSGKSTLLHLLGGLDQPTQGQVALRGQRFSDLSDDARSKLRNERLGFVYQFHHLLPEFTALENVMIPLIIRRSNRQTAKAQAHNILDMVGLGERLSHKPAQLSGGERQRCALARALVTEPDCILADEPTGNLDPETAEHVYSVMCEINRRCGTSFVVVTHDEQLAARLEKTYRIEKGVLRAA